MDDIRMIRAFVVDHANGAAIDDDEDLFSSGHLDSLFAVQLVMWVERTFGMTVESADLDFENFRSIADIGAFVERKRSATARA